MSTSQAVSISEDIDARIGRRVHQLMWDRQVTQTVLGDTIGMDPSSVAKRLRGRLGWNASQLIATASALKTTVAYLVGETGSPNPVGPTGLEPMTSTV